MATLNNDALNNYYSPGYYSGFNGTDDADSLRNYDHNYVAIYGYAGNDTIENIASNNVLIEAGDDDDIIWSSGDTVTIDGGNGNDTINSGGSGCNYVTINSGNGDDNIFTDFDDNNFFIDGGGGNDFINNRANNTTINGGEGDDYIWSNGVSINFVYTEGDGNDSIGEYDTTDTISITSGSGYSTTTSGNDLIINVGEGSMRLVDAASISPVIVGADLVDTGSGGEDTVTPVDTTPSGEDTTPAVDTTSSGEDTISTVDTTSSGEDTITPVTTPADVSTVYVDLSTIDSDSGAFVIDGTSSNATFKSAAAENETVVGNVAGQIYTAENILPQSIYNSTSNWTIGASSQNDSISNYASNVSINAGEGGDYVYNSFAMNYTTINGGTGNDIIDNKGRFCIIYGGDGDDSILSDIRNDTYEDNTVYGGAGNDTLIVNDHKTLLDGGEGDDVVSVQGGNWDTNTLQGGTGNDTLYGGGSNVFVYNEGDGDDLVKNYRTGDAIKISTTYDSIVSGNDIILNIAGDGHITLESAYSQAVIINDETIHGGVSTSTMHMSRWSYSFGTSTVSGSSNLASSEDLINGGEVSYYYGRGSQITYNADKNDTVNLFGVSLDQITSAEISAGAVNITFNDGGSLTMLGQSNSQFILNGSMWTAYQSTQTWTKTS